MKWDDAISGLVNAPQWARDEACEITERTEADGKLVYVMPAPKKVLLASEIATALARAETAGHPTTRRLLAVLRDLGTDGALSVYGINVDEPDDLPLDTAIRDWMRAGCPGANGEE